MKVTDIKQQVKNSNRFSIFIDHKYSFSLSGNDLIDLGIKVDQEFSEADLSKLVNDLDYRKAKDACLNLLSYRTRSEWEIQTYLRRKKYDPAIIKQVITYLTSKGYINDEAFAKQWVENRLRLKQTSLRHLKYELKIKKVPDSIINEVIDSQSVDEVELIRQIIDKKRLQTRYQDDLKLMQYLARRGYDYDKIKQALQPKN